MRGLRLRLDAVGFRAPFIFRVVVEDFEPTLRFRCAPGVVHLERVDEEVIVQRLHALCEDASPAFGHVNAEHTHATLVKSSRHNDDGC